MRQRNQLNQPDETDLTREDLMAMMEHGEPVEIVDNSFDWEKPPPAFREPATDLLTTPAHAECCAFHCHAAEDRDHDDTHGATNHHDHPHAELTLYRRDKGDFFHWHEAWEQKTSGIGP